MSRYWVDVDNPPQAQYLSPIAGELRRRGHEVIMTARDHAPTLAVLANRGESAVPVGRPPGPSMVAKASGTLRRAARLSATVWRQVGRPEALVSTSRSGTLAGRLLGTRVFTVLDYEGVELGVFKAAGTTILHPDVIPPEAFSDRGFPEDRLRSFPGLKEDLSLQGFLPGKGSGGGTRTTVLVRPPSETSHYRADQTMDVLRSVLEHLAARSDVQVVFSPREDAQNDLVNHGEWAVPPRVLDRPVPVLDLLDSVDVVVTGGGTMLREAAWMGIPAVSVFQGPMPAVDRWLESRGAITSLTPESDLSGIDWRGARAPRIEHHPEALARVVDLICGRP